MFFWLHPIWALKSNLLSVSGILGLDVPTPQASWALTLIFPESWPHDFPIFSVWYAISSQFCVHYPILKTLNSIINLSHKVALDIFIIALVSHGVILGAKVVARFMIWTFQSQISGTVVPTNVRIANSNFLIFDHLIPKIILKVLAVKNFVRFIKNLIFAKTTAITIVKNRFFIVSCKFMLLTLSTHFHTIYFATKFEIIIFGKFGFHPVEIQAVVRELS